LALAVLFPNILAGIPSAVLSGVLLGVGLLLFDSWTVQLISDVRKAASKSDRRRVAYDLIVVFLVMGTTVFYSIVAGVIAGCLLAGLVFIVNMSRPIVRRTFFGNEIQSKRLRSAQDMAILRESGMQRAVLQLDGVLFFGNADDLSAQVKSLFQRFNDDFDFFRVSLKHKHPPALASRSGCLPGVLLSRHPGNAYEAG
jgi:MFS superfamily sulfate permease-like transporter